jgi:Flp pilus assembly protein TadG
VIRRHLDRGQSTVEYAIVVPILLLILLGILEFGFAFSHHITMQYATREGARTGAALNNGTAAFACKDVDDQIIAAVQRVLTASGSQVDLTKVSLHIYEADTSGQETTHAEVWKPGAGDKVDGVALNFVRSSGNWDACSRKDDGFGKTDSLGVSMTYDYRYVTPLGSLMGLSGSPSLHMTDRTVMALNPD